MALFAGAFDERIALTIAQEPGGGGDATWRFSQTIGPSVEILSNAQGSAWYYQDVSQFNNAVTKLPFDHHEVMAMIAPRALFVLGNPDSRFIRLCRVYGSKRGLESTWSTRQVRLF
jgi:hypothetical protein